MIAKWFKNTWYQKRSIALELIRKLASYQEIVQITPRPCHPTHVWCFECSKEAVRLHFVPCEECFPSCQTSHFCFVSRRSEPASVSLCWNSPLCFVCNFADVGAESVTLHRGSRGAAWLLSFAPSEDNKNF